MSHRIMYRDKPNNRKESVGTFISESTGAKYKVILDLNEMKFYIKNLSSHALLKHPRNHSENLNVLKRKARAYLEKLGVKLKREIRNRSFGRCKKGYTQKDHQNAKEST